MSKEFLLGECPVCSTHVMEPSSGGGDGDLVKCPGCEATLEVRIDVTLAVVDPEADTR